ncbi:YsnF/AvaK domain-containing protein [Arthrobacter sp. Br18]|uniref:YsnF/AvaK domain-containing protein n=1 Tax=Arthrobacter sp. Br18 TaxID=1312954 RepID=UPI0004B8E7B1|nr:YsnF/AvaK domain-containing protein [Arthrobacter sp. Br18]
MATRKQVERPVGDPTEAERETGDPASSSGITGHVDKKRGSRKASKSMSAGSSTPPTGAAAPAPGAAPASRKGRKGKKIANRAAAGSGSSAARTAARPVHGGASSPPAAHVIVRSEEQFRALTQTKQRGRVRLHKIVVTENVTRTVTIRREAIRVDRGSGAADAASMAGPGPVSTAAEAPVTVIDGSDLGKGGYTIVLHEERPVIRMETVALKRVRLTKDMVLDEEALTADVRKEVVETGSIDTAGRDETPTPTPATRSTDDYAG